MSGRRAALPGGFGPRLLGNSTVAVCLAFACLQALLTVLYYNRKMDDYRRERIEHLELISEAVVSAMPALVPISSIDHALAGAGIRTLRFYDRGGREIRSFGWPTELGSGGSDGLGRALTGARHSKVLPSGEGELLVAFLPLSDTHPAKSGAAAIMGAFRYEELESEALSSTASFALPSSGILFLVALALSVFLRHYREADERVRLAAEETIWVKNRFLSTVSHELRTPLNGIMGMLTLLKSTRLDGEQEEYVEMAGRCSDSLLALVEDILEHVKFEVGRTAVAETPFSLRRELSLMGEPIAQAARVKGVEFTVDVASEVPDGLTGDAPKLMRVLENLLDNGVKFTSTGSVRLTVTLAQVPGPGRTLIFKVMDTGPGIQPEKLARLFEPLTQADQSSTRGFGGMGIGLTLTRELVHAMKGTIRVESSPGAGSTFIVRLPFDVGPVRDGAVMALGEALAAHGGDLAGTLTFLRNALHVLGAAQSALSSGAQGGAGPDLEGLGRTAREVGARELNARVISYREALATGEGREGAARALETELARVAEEIAAMMKG